MPLPKIQHPIHTLTLPSNNVEVKFRPFLVREEKLLLMAKQGEDPKDMYNAVKQIINNCIIEPKLDVDKLPTFDMEYFFLKLRATSINSIVNVSYRDTEDDKVYDFDINLNDVKIKRNPEHTNKIKLSEDLGIVLRYPTSDLFAKIDFENDRETSIGTIIACIESIYDDESVYNPADYTREEMEEFIQDMDHDALNAILKFLQTMPKLYYEIEFTNSKGTKRKIELDSLADFFTLG